VHRAGPQNVRLQRDFNRYGLLVSHVRSPPSL
jgi:hypothetical protein